MVIKRWWGSWWWWWWMIADTGQMSYIHRLMLFVPTGTLLQGWHLSDEWQEMLQVLRRSFCTDKLLHTEASTQRNLYTEQPIHTKVWQGETLAGRNFYTAQFSHTNAFAHRWVYMQRLWHRGAFTHRSLYAVHGRPQKLWHRAAFAHRRF